MCQLINDALQFRFNFVDLAFENFRGSVYCILEVLNFIFVDHIDPVM